ncbi:MAG: hypothetical protein ACE147_00800 [Candidatus Methylomirabilales bacterium]
MLTAEDSIPLSRAALCLESGCERVFRIERRSCPTCGSHAIIPLQRFLVARARGAADPVRAAVGL